MKLYFNSAHGELAPELFDGDPPADQSALVAQLTAERDALQAKIDAARTAAQGVLDALA